MIVDDVVQEGVGGQIFFSQAIIYDNQNAANHQAECICIVMLSQYFLNLDHI